MELEVTPRTSHVSPPHAEKEGDPARAYIPLVRTPWANEPETPADVHTPLPIFGQKGG